MAIEIERKFLVRNNYWQEKAETGLPCRQGYLCAEHGKTVRVRTLGARAFLTIKGKTHGLSRAEFEYEIPVDDAEALLQMCDQRIEKTRYLVPHENHTWEVDVFEGENKGLILAEIELKSEDETFILPDWIGDEVSGDPRYYNAQLSRHPFTRWNQ